MATTKDLSREKFYSPSMTYKHFKNILTLNQISIRRKCDAPPSWAGNWRRQLALKVTKSGTNSTYRCIKYMIKNNPYEIWYNRSTRRRARRRAKKSYKQIVKHKPLLDYDEIEEKLFDVDTSEVPSLEPPVSTESTAEVDEETSSIKTTPKKGKGESKKKKEDKPTHIKVEAAPVPKKTEKRPVIKFARGERARELAAAAELKFGAMVKSPANKEIVRRYMSRHELVIDFSVRETHRLALVNRAIKFYFIPTENDLVEHYTIENKKNTKRHLQMAAGSC
jgi:hypothetical protein